MRISLLENEKTLVTSYLIPEKIKSSKFGAESDKDEIYIMNKYLNFVCTNKISQPQFEVIKNEYSKSLKL